jgi:hypothetical protein
MEDQSPKKPHLTSIPEGTSDEKVPDSDDTVLKEFKMKYQKSLEVIQSLQEILELKKSYGSIAHSYNAVSPSSNYSLSYFYFFLSQNLPF